MAFDLFLLKSWHVVAFFHQFLPNQVSHIILWLLTYSFFYTFVYFIFFFDPLSIPPSIIYFSSFPSSLLHIFFFYNPNLIFFDSSLSILLTFSFSLPSLPFSYHFFLSHQFILFLPSSPTLSYLLFSFLPFLSFHFVFPLPLRCCKPPLSSYFSISHLFSYLLFHFLSPILTFLFFLLSNSSSSHALKIFYFYSTKSFIICFRFLSSHFCFSITFTLPFFSPSLRLSPYSSLCSTYSLLLHLSLLSFTFT